MTSFEKIENAKNRINELEMLIEFWKNSEGKNPRVVNISSKVNNKVA